VRLAGHTYSFRSLPLAAALERLTGLGFGDVEIWLGHVRGAPDGAAETVRRAGVRVRAVSAGGYYRRDDDTPRRALDLAGTLGAGVVALCVAPSLIPELARLTPPTVCVAVENHWDQPLARSREVAAAIESSRLEACLDTGHALAAGERPERAAVHLGARLRHVHLKEGRLASPAERVLGRRLRRRLLGKPEPVPAGDGDLDLRAFSDALARIGFQGYVTVEHEGDRADEALGLLSDRWRALAAPS
jgi:sugar phosphate isomerase/epimerase